jgi:AcrR family transcriptional regulator
LTSKAGKREKRAEQNRKRLLNAAMTVFSRKGFHKATVDEICRRANLGKGTVYQYFGNKKDLFLGIVDSFAADLGKRVESAVEGISDDLRRLEAAITEYVQFHAAHRSFYRLVIHEQSSFAREIHERFRTEYLSHLRILEDILRQGMKRGKLKRLNLRSATFALVGICNSVIFHWLLSEGNYALTKETPVISEIFLRGICLRPNGRGMQNSPRRTQRAQRVKAAQASPPASSHGRAKG